jgi:hypothetical protein
MKRWQLALLIFEVALFAIILILPQVDLPDFTFHGGTAPAAVKARTSVPSVQAITATAPSSGFIKFSEQPADLTMLAADAGSSPRLSSLCILLC